MWLTPIMERADFCSHYIVVPMNDLIALKRVALAHVPFMHFHSVCIHLQIIISMMQAFGIHT